MEESYYCFSLLKRWAGSKNDFGEILKFHSVKHGSASAFMEVGGGFPQWLSGKEPACGSGDAGDLSLIPGSGRFLGEGDSNFLQHSCLENPMDRETWWATVHGVMKSWTQLRRAHGIIQLPAWSLRSMLRNC